MTHGRINRALLLARTARNLRASQILHRARLRAQRFPASRPAASLVIDLLPSKHQPAVGWPVEFVPLDLQLAEGFPAPEDNALGTFAFLNDPRKLGLPTRWDAPGASRLWRYHLHYMEWAWSFASHRDRSWARHSFAELWKSWDQAAPFGRGDPWAPYVASLRAWVLCGAYRALVADANVQPSVDAALVRHARFLRWHVEHDVGGNHLMKNLKALVGLGVFLGDIGLVRHAMAHIERQLPVQILSDGGHYERSPSYHCQVLGDLIDIGGLLHTAGLPPVSGLTDAIDAMRTWLGVILMPDGDVPLLNDCTLVGHLRLALLHPGPPSVRRSTVLSDSGYVVVRVGERLHMVADVGDPCPPDLPAHAHADCLTFELAVDGQRLVVDSGTSTYEPGRPRARERSTGAHNTVCIDREDQTEVWSSFRAARMAHGHLETIEDDGEVVSVVASHDGYRRLPGAPVHRRTWRVGAGQLAISDEVTGKGQHRIDSLLHLATSDAAKVVWSAPSDLMVSDTPMTYATGFGRLHEGRLVSAAWTGTLPVEIKMEIHIPEPQSERAWSAPVHN